MQGEISGVDDVAAYERAFRRAGLPLLIEDYSAREDVFTRAVPLLTLVLLVEVLGAIDLKWSVGRQPRRGVGGLAFVLLALGLLNRARGRPFLSRPRDIGTAELVGFVAVPALLPLVFGGQWRSALVTAAGNALLLALVYGDRRLRPDVDRALGRRAGSCASSWPRCRCSRAPCRCCSSSPSS